MKKVVEFFFTMAGSLFITAIMYWVIVNWALAGPVVYKTYPEGKIVDVIAYENGKEVHKTSDWLKSHKTYDLVWVSPDYKPKQ